MGDKVKQAERKYCRLGATVIMFAAAIGMNFDVESAVDTADIKLANYPGSSSRINACWLRGY